MLQNDTVAGTFRRAMGLGSGGGDQGPPGSRRPPPPVRLGMVAVGGVEFAVTILVGLFVGQWLDRRFGTGPWLLMLGVFAGGAVGFYNLYRALTTGERRARSHDDTDRAPRE